MSCLQLIFNCSSQKKKGKREEEREGERKEKRKEGKKEEREGEKDCDSKSLIELGTKKDNHK